MTVTKAWVLAVVVLAACSFRPGQQTNSPNSDTCRMPAWDRSVQLGNLFNEEQEQWLGEIIDQDLKKEFNVIEDPDGYLQKIGERLLAQLPPTKIHYHF